jgi:hypothetical protein
MVMSFQQKTFTGGHKSENPGGEISLSGKNNFSNKEPSFVSIVFEIWDLARD